MYKPDSKNRNLFLDCNLKNFPCNDIIYVIFVSLQNYTLINYNTINKAPAALTDQHYLFKPS